MRYRDLIGGGRCPIVDTWWQTETGQILISPLPGLTTTKPSSATIPLPGIGVDVLDDHGESIALGNGGYLVLARPWPAMARGIDGDERFFDTYWARLSRPSEHKWVYFAGDGAKVESALVDHPAVPRPSSSGIPSPASPSPLL